MPVPELTHVISLLLAAEKPVNAAPDEQIVCALPAVAVGVFCIVIVTADVDVLLAHGDVATEVIVTVILPEVISAALGV